jgi:hypothetical protein
MNNTDIRQVVDALAATRNRFRDYAVSLFVIPDLTSVNTSMDCCYNGEKPVVEFFVEVYIDAGSCVCWWMDLVAEENQWTIHRHVSVAHDGPMRRLPDIDVGVATKLKEQLLTAANELLLVSLSPITISRSPKSDAGTEATPKADGGELHL